MNTTDALNQKDLDALLALPDLTERPTHAISLIMHEIAQHLTGYPEPLWLRGEKIVSRAHNYDLLGYQPDDVTMAGRYTQWVDQEKLLRTQTTSLIAKALQEMDPQPVTLLAPGMVYRRDVRDRWHCGQPHQMDVWVVAPKGSVWDTHEALDGLIARVMHAGGCKPGSYTVTESLHSYTQGGRQVDAKWLGQDLEVLECGWIDPGLLERMGWDGAQWTGLALGLGLDRMVMVRKGLPDIRLLRDPHPLVSAQMQDLKKWREVSRQPGAKRDLSLCVPRGLEDERIVEQALMAMTHVDGVDRSNWVEQIDVVERWEWSGVPEQGRARLGMSENMDNVMIRVGLRDLTSTIPREDANTCLRAVYRAVHVGGGWAYCP